MSIFSAREYQRYSRHIQLAQIGATGQARLKQASVLLVGCGGLGAPVALYLAGAGVGSITLVDGDAVDLSNLQRQIAFSEHDIGSNKARCLQARLRSLNSDIEVHAVAAMLSPDSAVSLVEGKQLVIDCSDDFNVRCLLNHACLARQTAWIYASVIRMSGQCALFLPGGPCFSCLFPDAPQHAEDCNSAGVLASLPGLLGSLQASIALQFLAGETCFDGEALTLVEAAPLQLHTLHMRKRPGCEICGNGHTATALNHT
ncbi:MAG: HesA/MoeB/ThiF family protein, partial [Pseudomonadales bacterium]